MEIQTLVLLSICVWETTSTHMYNCETKNSFCKRNLQPSFEHNQQFEFDKRLDIGVPNTQQETVKDQKILYNYNNVAFKETQSIHNFLPNNGTSDSKSSTYSKQSTAAFSIRHFEVNSHQIVKDKKCSKTFYNSSNEMQYAKSLIKTHNLSTENKASDYKKLLHIDVVTNGPTGNIILPQGIQKESKRISRRSDDYRNRHISYQSLCPIKRVPVTLETTDFEYRPNQYIEVTCANSNSHTNTNMNDKNKICSEAGFSCMQLNRTIHLIRRNKFASSECWESEIRVVPSGCECMWPKHYGDILAYHESQKRFNSGSTREYYSFLQDYSSVAKTVH